MPNHAYASCTVTEDRKKGCGDLVRVGPGGLSSQTRGAVGADRFTYAILNTECRNSPLQSLATTSSKIRDNMTDNWPRPRSKAGSHSGYRAANSLLGRTGCLGAALAWSVACREKLTMNESMRGLSQSAFVVDRSNFTAIFERPHPGSPRHFSEGFPVHAPVRASINSQIEIVVSLVTSRTTDFLPESSCR